MPVAQQIAGLATNYGPSLYDWYQRRRAQNNAQGALLGGVGESEALIGQAAEDAQGVYRGAYEDANKALDPYMQAGRTGLDQLTAGLQPGGEFGTYNKQFTAPTTGIPESFDRQFKTPTGADMMVDPGYAFRLAEGNKALDRRAASMGVYDTGGFAQQAMRYNQDAASQEYQNVFNRSLTEHNTAQSDWLANRNEFGRTYDRARGEFDLDRDIFRTNQADRFGRLNTLTGIGRDATTQQIGAGSEYAARTAQTGLLTAQQLADLRAQRANVNANADVAGAANNSGLLDRGVQIAQDTGLVNRLFGGAKTLAGPAAAAAGLAGYGAGPAAASIAGLGGAGAGLTPAVPGAMLGSGAAGTSAATSTAASGGLGQTLTGLATNPVTIGVAGALAAGAIWLKSQAHWEANTGVKDFENPFAEKSLAPFVQEYNKAEASGQLTADQAQASWQQFTQNFQDYIDRITKWAGESSDKQRVARQSIANLSPQIEQIQNDILQDVQRLSGAAA